MTIPRAMMDMVVATIRERKKLILRVAVIYVAIVVAWNALPFAWYWRAAIFLVIMSASRGFYPLAQVYLEKARFWGREIRKGRLVPDDRTGRSSRSIE